MREILFKAKKLDNVEWVEGFYVHKTNGGFKGAYILENNTLQSIKMGFTDLIHHQVDPETVSQFTGLTDKNDNNIWEGSDVKYTTKIRGKLVEIATKVIWYNNMFTVADNKSKIMDFAVLRICEVIGNRFDNPEILQSEK